MLDNAANTTMYRSKAERGFIRLRLKCNEVAIAISGAPKSGDIYPSSPLIGNLKLNVKLDELLFRDKRLPLMQRMAPLSNQNENTLTNKETSPCSCCSDNEV